MKKRRTSEDEFAAKVRREKREKVGVHDNSNEDDNDEIT